MGATEKGNGHAVPKAPGCKRSKAKGAGARVERGAASATENADHHSATAGHLLPAVSSALLLAVGMVTASGAFHEQQSFLFSVCFSHSAFGQGAGSKRYYRAAGRQNRGQAHRPARRR